MVFIFSGDDTPLTTEEQAVIVAINPENEKLYRNLSSRRNTPKPEEEDGELLLDDEPHIDEFDEETKTVTKFLNHFGVKFKNCEHQRVLHHYYFF